MAYFVKKIKIKIKIQYLTKLWMIFLNLTKNSHTQIHMNYYQICTFIFYLHVLSCIKSNSINTTSTFIYLRKTMLLIKEWDVIHIFYDI